ncbi:MAG: hypothetical protein E7007_01075 [Alphaproteobacteria bacterium]|nr:hypothetical protein [Alphaproteobacteria bacterium]
MSHFTVLVVGNNPEELLEKYDENEHLVFESREEKLRKEFENDRIRIDINKTNEQGSHFIVLKENEEEPKCPNQTFKEYYKDIDTFAHEYFGYIKNENGEYGVMANPNAKWDWYELGGRWPNHLPLKGGGGANQAIWRTVDKDQLKHIFAVLTEDGWYEMGQMRFFGFVENKKSDEEWEKEFKELISKIDPDETVSVYDCHI